MTTDRAVRAAVRGGGALVLAFAVFYLGGWGGDGARQVLTDAVYLPLSLLATVLGLRLVRSGGLDRRGRRAWTFITAAFVCQMIAHTSWFVEDAVLHSLTYPAFADYWFLGFSLFMLPGLLLLPARRHTRGELIKLGLDALIVGSGTFMVLWYLVLGPIVVDAHTGTSLILYSAALPVMDLLVLLALAALMLRREPGEDRAVRLVAAAVALYVVADFAYAYLQLHVGFMGGMWPDLFWIAGNYLLILATHRRYRAEPQPVTVRAGRSATGFLPYAVAFAAYGLLGLLADDLPLYPLGGMVLGAIVLTTLAMIRQMYSLRENRLLAVTDPLTGLANRALINERLAELTGQPLRAGRHGAVMLIDLDRFKPINDVHGHEAGDAVLRAVAATLRTLVGPGDTVGRLGGDEFAVVLTDLPDLAAAADIAERMVEALRTPVIFGELVLGIEASIGVAVRDEDTPDAEVLLHHADIAMYAAKRSGRSRFRVYTADLDTRSRDAELRRAVDNGELVVHFQPAVELAGGRIVGAEALVRWNHPRHGLLMPASFIDLAEETGTVIAIGEWVLREACRQAAAWHDGDPPYLSVNLSPLQAALPGLVDIVGGILDETGFPAHRLVLELTESVILQPDQATTERLEALRERGIRIAVDDFGTGYAALSYLRTLPVDVLKIDRSFVTGIDTDPQRYDVAEAVVRLGRAFRMTVVAEGIETAGQARAITAMGCDYGQGFAFGHPVPGPQIAALLESARADA